ncbi:MAG TPA: hypothetical protein VM598_10670, partial [Bdellovibrionota bacterium]|nr:hypothetical protein [Bdellovibrionota bacterium]
DLSAVAPGAMPSIGLFPLGSASMVADQFAETREEARKLRKPALPFRAETLRGWRVGDNLRMQLSGGLVFTANIGMMGLISIGPAFVAKGDWISYVEKASEHEVLLKHTKGRLRALSVSTGAFLATIDRTYFRNADESFSFRFDLRDPRAVEAYEDAVRGNLTLAQKLADDPTGAVRPEVTARTLALGRMLQVSIKIPMLFAASASSGRIAGFEETRVHADGSLVESRYAIFARERKQRLGHRHRSRGDSFFAGVITAATPAGGRHESRIATLTLSVADENASGGRLDSAVRRMVRQTGLRELLSLEFPRVKGLGYASITVELSLSPEATAGLLEAAGRERVGADLSARAAQLVESYLSDGTDPDRLCDRHTGPRGLDAAACEAELKDLAGHAARDAARALRKLKAEAEPGAFAKAYAELGKAALASQFVLRSILGLVEPSSVSASYEIEGERLAKARRSLAPAR